MILTRDAILAEIDKKNIVITPFNHDQIGTASYDLTLSKVFRRMNPDAPMIQINKDTNFEDYTEHFEADGPFILRPGELILGITEEAIQLPTNICAWLQGRTTYARVGLIVHITAAFVHPGVHNKQVMEIFNASSLPQEIFPGTRVLQIIFQRCEGNARYDGWANDQEL